MNELAILLMFACSSPCTLLSEGNELHVYTDVKIPEWSFIVDDIEVYVWQRDMWANPPTTKET